jgi:drug/metabolite transporter (DMT)-like permease
MQKEKWMLLGAMGIFGTIGLIVRYIPLSSAVIACARGFMGLVFLLGVMLFTKKKPDLPAIRRNLLLLAVSGAAMGFNWILLFESYRYTTVATATVCYYLAPLMLLLACPLLGERLTAKKLLCVGIALVGLVFVSGVLQQMPTKEELLGIAFGLGAAVLYASVMFMNKKLSPIPAYDKTILQLGSAAIVILPYILLTEGLPSFSLTAIQWVLLIVVGIVHTGIAYALYFGSMKSLRAQTIAVFSYLDPVIAVLLSALVLRETMTWGNILGAILILGSALYSELPTKEQSVS